jgi:hypothetical protein
VITLHRCLREDGQVEYKVVLQLPTGEKIESPPLERGKGKLGEWVKAFLELKAHFNPSPSLSKAGT